MGKIIFAVTGFVLAGVLLFFYTIPTYSGPGTTDHPSVSELNAQIAQYQGALDKAAQLQALKQKLLARYNAFNPTDLSRLQTMLPDHVDNIGLILELDNLASHWGLALENVDVAAAQPDANNQSAVAVVGASAQKYDSLILHFATFGTYDNFRAFLLDLESSLRLVDLQSLTVSGQGTPGAAPVYRYEMTIKTYWLK
jgi:hypothetical protein